MRISLLFILLLTLRGPACAQAPVLVSDIQDEGSGFDFRGRGNIGFVGNRVIFSSGTTATGFEPWYHDTLTDETELLLDINPGEQFSRPNHFGRLGDQLLFTAYTPQTGIELFRTDGTPEGTGLVSETRNGSESVIPFFDNFGISRMEYAVVGGYYYFIAETTSVPNDFLVHYRLWRSDGTSEATVRITDLALKSGSIGSKTMYAWNDMLYLIATGPDGKEHLYRTDGSRTGEELVFENNTRLSNGSYPRGLTAFRDSLYFFSADFRGNYDLFRTDGTPEGTDLVFDLPGDGQVPPQRTSTCLAAALDDLLVFTAYDNQEYTLWATDGTEEGTVLLSDGEDQEISRPASQLTRFGDRILFIYDDDGTRGLELWETRGTPETTRRLTDLSPGRTSGFFSNAELFVHAGRLYVMGMTDFSTRNLYTLSQDGEELELVLTDDTNEPLSASEYIGVDDKIFFYGTTATYGSELYAIRGLDFTNTISFTPVGEVGIKVFPNPFRDQLSVSVTESAVTGYTLYDWSGRRLQQAGYPVPQTDVTLDLAVTAARGPLFLLLNLEDGRTARAQLIRQ